MLTLEKETSFDIFVSCLFVNRLLGWNTNCATSNFTLDVYVFFSTALFTFELIYVWNDRLP